MKSSTSFDKLLLLIVLSIISFACLTPAVATMTAEPVKLLSDAELSTLVAGTSNAALIQTASALPTITSTSTVTRIPSKTPTSTPTFIYLLHTATAVPSYTPLVPVGPITVFNGTITVDERLTDRPWTCLVLGSTPSRGVPQKHGRDFYVTWAVMNTGTETWPYYGIDFVYESGYRTEQRHIQDLANSVVTGKGIDLKILLTAPDNAGTYNAIWALKVGHKAFCHMKIVFTVE